MDDDIFKKCSHLNKFTRFKELCLLKGESEPTYKPLNQTILKSLGCKELTRPVLNIEGRYSPETKNQVVLSWHVIDHSIGMRITSRNIMPFIDKFLIYGTSVRNSRRNQREELRESTFVLVHEVEPEDRFPMKLLLNDVSKNILYGFKVRIRFKDARFSMFSNIEELKI